MLSCIACANEPSVLFMGKVCANRDMFNLVERRTLAMHIFQLHIRTLCTCCTKSHRVPQLGVRD